jgi:hypothetical protein
MIGKGGRFWRLGLLCVASAAVGAGVTVAGQTLVDGADDGFAKQFWAADGQHILLRTEDSGRGAVRHADRTIPGASRATSGMKQFVDHKGRVVVTVWTDPQTNCQYLIRDNAITPRMYESGAQFCASGRFEALSSLRSEVESASQEAARRRDEARARSHPSAKPGSPLRP